MSEVKKLVLRPISRKEADELVKRVHYSHNTLNNSKIHIGVFFNGKLEGAMQFGPSMDKSKTVTLVSGTQWNEFIELNRMAFSDALPRNSESRAIAVAMRILRKHAPQLKWVISFADGTQCGDGTIYRASGFVLTGIKKNTQIWELPTGERFTRLVATNTTRPKRGNLINKLSSITGIEIVDSGGASMRVFVEAGAKPVPGYQLRYLYFLDPDARQRVTVPILPFSEIERLGAGMYKGKSVSRATSIDGDAISVPTDEGSSSLTVALHTSEEAVNA